MICQLKGKVAQKNIDHLVVDVGGIGFKVFSSLQSLSQIPEPGEEVFLHIHTNVRPEAINLYGFVDETERDLFLAVIGVSNIGPRLALNILSGMKVNQLLSDIKNKQISSIVRIPGVGKKTAERLVVELKDKVDKIFPDQMTAPHPAIKDNLLDELSNALKNLGYKTSEINRVINKLGQTSEPDTTLTKLIRNALNILSKRG